MLQITITKIEDNKAEVTLPDAQKINVPLSLIKGNPQVGSQAYLMIATAGAESVANQELAQNILNEIIGRE